MDDLLIEEKNNPLIIRNFTASTKLIDLLSININKKYYVKTNPSLDKSIAFFISMAIRRPMLIGMS